MKSKYKQTKTEKQDPNPDGKDIARRKPINQMQTATHGHTKTKTRHKSTHGIAMGS
jgi:hypothetical protein